MCVKASLPTVVDVVLELQIVEFSVFCHLESVLACIQKTSSVVSVLTFWV